MKLNNVFRIISILAYCFIMLQGMMIGMCFIIFLLAASLTEWGTMTQFSTLFALGGLFLLLALTMNQKTKKTLLIETIVFFLLLLPIMVRVTSVPISLFNYPAFISQQ
jgi:hypothetical protein